MDIRLSGMEHVKHIENPLSVVLKDLSGLNGGWINCYITKLTFVMQQEQQVGSSEKAINVEDSQLDLLK